VSDQDRLKLNRKPGAYPSTRHVDQTQPKQETDDAQVKEMNEPGPGETGGCQSLHDLVPPTRGDANQQWWPNRLNLRILAKNTPEKNPYGADFDYAAAFAALDLAEVKRDIESVSPPRTGGRPTSGTTAP
jgi:catalase-peroxidase